jgi:hypothetical protein
MPRIITKTKGTLKILKTFSRSKCLVVRLKRATKDTDVVTRMTNKAAPDTPGRVMMRLALAIFKVKSGSPGVKILNKAGRTMKRENKGMNTHVLFKKNPRPILEKWVNNKHNA